MKIHKNIINIAGKRDIEYKNIGTFRIEQINLFIMKHILLLI